MTNDNPHTQESIEQRRHYQDFEDSGRTLRAISCDLREMLVYLAMIKPMEEAAAFNGRIDSILMKIENLLANHKIDDPVLRRHLSIRILCAIFMEIV